MFAVVGDLGVGDELALHQVLTWPTFGDLRRYCDPVKAAGRSPWDLVSKTVQLGERGSTFTGSMSIPVASGDGEADSWLVQLGPDRALSELREGQTVTKLESSWQGSDMSSTWRVLARPAGTLTVSGDKLVVAGIPGANT